MTDLFRYDDDPGIGVSRDCRRAARRSVPSSPRTGAPLGIVSKESDAAPDIEAWARMASADIALDRQIRPRRRRPLLWHVGNLLGAIAIAGLVLIALVGLPS